jgi:broad specificity phosphatase PhoE
MTDILLLRHGHAKNNEAIDAHSLIGIDAPLTELGRMQAHQLAHSPVLNKYRGSRLYSSALSRAKETAELAFPGFSITADAAFNEIETNLHAAHAYHIPDTVLRGHMYRSTEGETILTFFERAIARLGQLASAHQRFAVVTHAGVINAAYHFYAGVPLPRFPILHVENACGLEFQLEQGQLVKLSFVSR